MSKTRGFTGALVALVLMVGAIALYFAYQKYSERYYIVLYDKTIVRRLDVPPYSVRKSPESDSLRGRCVLKIGTSAEQVNTFLSAVCSRQGFSFQELNKAFQIEIRPGYSVTGTYTDEATLEITWQPWLDEETRKKYKELFGTDWVEPQRTKIPSSPKPFR